MDTRQLLGQRYNQLCAIAEMFVGMPVAVLTPREALIVQVLITANLLIKDDDDVLQRKES